MKILRLWLFVIAGAASILASSVSEARGLDFNFSLTNTQGNVPGTITGTIQGLSDNATSAASDIIITSYPAGLNINPAVTAPFSLFSYLDSVGGTGASENSFTVTNGVITNDKFTYTIFNVKIYQVYLGGMSGPYNYINLDGTNNNSVAGVNGNLVAAYSATVPFDIPGGATIPTLGFLFALALMRKAKKRSALKTQVVNPVETVVCLSESGCPGFED